jgi:hypothetical protein
MNAHFFDLSTLIRSNSKVWIVSKLKPSIPILKIEQSEFNLIKNGVWFKNGEKIMIGGVYHWIKKETSDLLKIKCTKTNTNFSDLSFSMQEFMNPEIIDKVDFEIYENNFEHLKNTKDDLYVICSKNTKRNSEVLIRKLEEKLSNYGIVIKNYYYISETFFNREEDEISYKKVRLILQHLIGLKSEGDKFKNESITQYDTIFFYDNSKKSLFDMSEMNKTFDFMKSNSDDDVKMILKDVFQKDLRVIIKEVTFNKLNKFITSDVKLSPLRIIKTFESFRYKN